MVKMSQLMPSMMLASSLTRNDDLFYNVYTHLLLMRSSSLIHSYVYARSASHTAIISLPLANSLLKFEPSALIPLSSLKKIGRQPCHVSKRRQGWQKHANLNQSSVVGDFNLASSERFGF